jgi:hypothetical protein
MSSSICQAVPGLYFFATPYPPLAPLKGLYGPAFQASLIKSVHYDRKPVTER